MRRLSGPAEVHRGERRPALGQSFGDADARRERLHHVAERVPVLAHEREDLGGAHALGGRIVSHRPRPPRGAARADLDADRVMRDLEAPTPVGLAVQHQARARGIAAHKPWLIEERGPHRSGLVEHGRLDKPAHPAAAHRSAGDRADLHGHRRLLAHAQLRHRACLAMVARHVLEQLSDAVQAERSHSLDGLGHSQLEWGAQARGPRPAHRRGEHLLPAQPPRRRKRARADAHILPGAGLRRDSGGGYGVRHLRPSMMTRQPVTLSAERFLAPFAKTTIALTIRIDNGY